MATTTHFGWTYPDVQGSVDSWGDILNNTIIAVDNTVWTLNPPAAGTINNMVIGGTVPQPGTFSTIVCNGNLLAGRTSPIYTEKFNVTQTTAGGYAAMLANTNAAPTDHIMFRATFTASAPNNGSAMFFYCDDNAVARAYLKSNGGWANYSANDSNLSDATLKKDITPYSGAMLTALETAFKAIQWGTFKYRDQTHDDPNHGYIAQNIEAAFGMIAPELVEETELGPKREESERKFKAVYDTDLTHIGLALLSRALTKIADLERRIFEAGL